MNKTFLIARFERRFPQALVGATASNTQMTGIGGQVVRQTRILSSLELGVGVTSATLHGVVARAEEEDHLPPVFGVTGEDLLTGGFTLDFRRMELSVEGSGAALPTDPTSP